MHLRRRKAVRIGDEDRALVKLDRNDVVRHAGVRVVPLVKSAPADDRAASGEPLPVQSLMVAAFTAVGDGRPVEVATPQTPLQPQLVFSGKGPELIVSAAQRAVGSSLSHH